MFPRPTVLLLIPHLGGGGAEQVVSLLARGLSPRKYRIHLCLITQQSAAPECAPPWVTVHCLGAPRVRAAAVSLLRLVRTIQPDLILSGIVHLNFLVLALRPFFPRKTRLLVRQTGMSSATTRFGHWPDNTRLLYRLLYRRADGILCQTQAMAADLAVPFGLPRTRMTVVPNPVDVLAIRRLARSAPAMFTGPGPHLLAVGRLSYEKGFDLLLTAFSSLRLEFPHADLTILGSGAEEAPLRSLRRALRLESCVHLRGHVSHAESYFPGATLFVLPSRSEGLPNALLEAAAAGLPLAALPAGGVPELLQNKPGAWIASEISSSALADTLREALLALIPGQRFAHPWIDEYRFDRAIGRYEEVIDDTLVRPAP